MESTSVSYGKAMPYFPVIDLLRCYTTAEAAAHYRQARALAEALGMRPLQAHCHHGLGTLYATVGQRAQTGLTRPRAMPSIALPRHASPVVTCRTYPQPAARI